MLKLLIVDDEPGICELIYGLINWEALGIMSIGSVLNGIDALDIIQSQKPDIVITDIQMPGITGLDLIEKSKAAIGDRTSFIVISGYREFEYAQQAIKYGVEDYILKPIKRDDLNLLLKRIVNKKIEDRENENSVSNMKKELSQKNAILRKNELLKGWLDPEHILSRDLFKFSKGDFLCFCVRVCMTDIDNLNEQIINTVLENIGMRLMKHFGNECYDLEYVINDCKLVLLMNYSDEDHWKYLDRRNVFQSFANEMRIQYEGFKVIFAIGDIADTSDNIGYAISTADEIINFRLMFGTKRLMEYRKIEEVPKEPKYEFKDSEFQQLIKYVTAFQKTEAELLIERIFRRFSDIESYDICNLYTVIYSRLTQLRYEILSSGMRSTKCELLSETKIPYTEKEIYLYLNNCCSITEMRIFFCAYVSQEINYCLELKKQKISEPVRIAQEYVKENLNKQISLEDVASCAFVSAGYLSTLFKDKTGVNFSDYVIGMRIDRARDLLCTTTKTIAEISEEVGYADYRHFSKVFFKTVGIKPTAYRKFYK